MKINSTLTSLVFFFILQAAQQAAKGMNVNLAKHLICLLCMGF